MFGYRVLGFGSGQAGSAPYGIEYLVVAGGGGGGSCWGSSPGGGGGGAGGFLTNLGGTAIELTPGETYTQTVGAGGVGPSSAIPSTSGAVSSLWW